MKKLKHNKLRNTGLVFEILTKNVMYEAVQNQRQVSLSIIKKNFKEGSELLKELALYQSLLNQTQNDPKELLNLVLESRSKLDINRLENEKYNLIRNIKKFYDINTFFETRTSNYKLTASVFKLFENKGIQMPDDYLTAKNLILESLSGNKSNSIVEEEVETKWRQQDENTRKVALKLFVEKFNQKYRSLNTRQKTLLSRYITEHTNQESFRNFILKEAGFVREKLTALSNKVYDPVTRIKLSETIDLLQNIISAPRIKTEHLSAMLKYYELIEDIDR